MVIEVTADDSVQFYKVPHSAGDDANVGSPFSKSFVGYFEDQTLRSEHPDAMGKQTAKDALELNAQCSYWVGVRDRVANQMVVWEGEGDSAMGIKPGTSGMRTGEAEAARRKGLILPQIITMGTITRRAIEKTWLTASNAKKNRVGSELKAMVKAPPGWVIVGADVDSEELWICSVMGDAQFGLHGATAVGWMTLEGTKSAGTDLHSKTASILGTSRNQAKIFNYSRIYGAGIRHATQLLLKANPAMLREEATRLAKELYATTKGNNTHSADSFGRKFWFGGTESFVFNKLEDVALSERPRTPALDCGITAALSRKFLPKAQFGNGRFGEDFMPSRINWVVQSSGVDYLHLLVTSMSHLCKHYDIGARFMLSVHDEVRYLAEEKDAHRAALALQIANLWTRAMFAYKLQMEDLPEGVAWFAQVDVDKVLRKEVDDPCVTPSQPEPIPHGKAYDIAETLAHTHGGSLYKDGRPMGTEGRRAGLETQAYPPYVPSDQKHRSLGERGMLFLQAQASADIHEIRALERRAQGMETRSAEGGDVVRPSRADLEDMVSKRSGKSEVKRRPYQKRGPSGVPRRSNAPLQPTSRANVGRKEGSSAQLAQNSVRHSSTSAHEVVASSLLELAREIPVRRRAPVTVEHSGRYWDLPGYSSYIRWHLYRQLLRNYPKEYVRHLRRAIRSRFRRLKGPDTSAATAMRNIERGEALLRIFKAANAGEDEAWDALNKLTVEREERYRLFEEGLARSAAKRTRRRPHILTGSLLRPHHSHGPLLRVKPPQPKISMMIRRRRFARTSRIHRGYELWAEKEMLVDEGTFYKGLLSHVLEPPKRRQEKVEASQPPRRAGRPVYKPRKVQRADQAAAKKRRVAEQEKRAHLLNDLNKFGPGFTWHGPIMDWHRQQNESFRRDEERANAQFTPQMLMRAKAARRTRLAYLTMRAEKRRQHKAAGESTAKKASK
jgi:DNA polymerase gamma 1